MDIEKKIWNLQNPQFSYSVKDLLRKPRLINQVKQEYKELMLKNGYTHGDLETLENVLKWMVYPIIQEHFEKKF